MKRSFFTLLVIIMSSIFGLLIAEESLVEVQIISDPEEADVYINSEKKIKTPGSVWLLPGQYDLKLSKKGYISTTQKLDIVQTKKMEFSYKLVENCGYLRLKVTPSQAQILINDEDYTGKTYIKLKPGHYKLVAKLSQYTDQSWEFDISFEQVINKNIELIGSGGTISFKIDPSDAIVRVNEEILGGSTKTLPPGDYTIVVSKDGYESLTEVITIKAGMNIEKEYSLIMKKGRLQYSVQPVETAVIMRRNGAVFKKWVGLNFLKDVPFGTYVLESRLSGYTSRKDTIEIKDNKMVIKNIIMEKGIEIPDKMVLLESGSFNMGRTYMNLRCPGIGHYEMVAAIWVGIHEVTQLEWSEVMGVNPSVVKGDSLPVTNISWFDAISYCNKKSLEEGLKPCYSIEGLKVICDFKGDGYRLPTKMEWEYAAKSGKVDSYDLYSGSDNSELVCWHDDNTLYIKPVGLKKANSAGLYDMSGNVWEYSWDFKKDYDKEGVSKKIKVNYSKPYEIQRLGGGVDVEAEYCSVLASKPILCTETDDIVGFRLFKTARE